MEYTVIFKTVEEMKKFVNEAGKIDADMDMKKGRVIVDAKSLLGVIGMGINQFMTLSVHKGNVLEIESFITPYRA